MMRRVTDRVVDFSLGNAEERNAEAPRSFFIPSRTEREGLRPGEIAQLMFVLAEPADGEPSAERMWVQVRERQGARYVGALDSQPAVITTVGPGDLVEFGPEHVIRLLEDWPLLEKKVFVSRRSHEDDVRPGFLYREAPDNEQDSGWRALVGDESDDEVDDPGSILLQSLGFLLDRWPELRPVLETDDESSEWAWDTGAARFVRLPDR